jgi:hypothetical protein
MSQDSGLAQRGFVLLGLMTVLVVVVLFILFQSPRQPVPVEKARPEHYVWSVVAPASTYPAAVSWPALFELGETLPSSEGWEIRYNAAATLARKGSDRVPWPLLREMLDENRQMRNFRTQLPDGADVPDETAARTAVLSTLKALAEWHRQRSASTTTVSGELRRVYEVVDRLAESPIPELSKEAQKARETFFRG